MNIAYTWWIRDLHHYNSYIPTYKQKDLRSESGTSRESNILCFWLCSLFCRVCHRDISDRPLEICVVRSPVDECCNRARKMNPYEAKRNCSREKFRVRPHHAETLCDTSQSANGVKQAHRAFKGDLIGTKRPSEEILVVDTIVVSLLPSSFLLYRSRFAFTSYRSSYVIARESWTRHRWTTLVLFSSNFLRSENYPIIIKGGEAKRRGDWRK